MGGRWRQAEPVITTLKTDVDLDLLRPRKRLGIKCERKVERDRVLIELCIDVEVLVKCCFGLGSGDRTGDVDVLTVGDSDNGFGRTAWSLGDGVDMPSTLDFRANDGMSGGAWLQCLRFYDG